MDNWVHLEEEREKERAGKEEERREIELHGRSPKAMFFAEIGFPTTGSAPESPVTKTPMSGRYCNSHCRLVEKKIIWLRADLSALRGRGLMADGESGYILLGRALQLEPI